MSGVLEARNLAKSYGRKPVFEDVSFSLEKGKVCGLLGRNGEGKTTLIRILAGVIPADKGQVIVYGRGVGFGETAHKRDIGTIPEESFFFGGMTIGELLDFNAAFYPRWDGGKAGDCLRMFALDRNAREVSGLLGFRGAAVAVNWEKSRLWLVNLDDETWRRIF